MYARELRVSYRRRRIRGASVLPDQISSPRDAAAAFARLLGDESVEVAGLLCLSTGHHVLAYHELSRGTVDAAMVHARDVLKVALLANARAVLIGHNHPSGDPTPSPDDVALTRRLKSAGDIVGVELADHIIVGDAGRYWSFREHNGL